MCAVFNSYVIANYIAWIPYVYIYTQLHTNSVYLCRKLNQQYMFLFITFYVSYTQIALSPNVVDGVFST